MAQPADRLERVGRLLACLLDRGHPVSRDELEDLFPEYHGESGRRRFEDDKAALRRAGIRLRVVEHLGVVEGYQLRRADYELPPLDLTADELVALRLAMGSVDFSVVAWTRLAGTKLGLGVDGSMAAQAQLPGLELLPALHDAVADRRDIRFGYQGESRHVDPWGLVVKHGRWYVPGFDRQRQATRNFRVDRMDAGSLVMGEAAAFEEPADVAVADLVPDDALVMQPGDRHIARLRADWRVARLIEPGVELDPDDSGWVPVEVEVSYVPAFVTWVLGFGELVRVDGPAELRQAVVARLRELAV